MLYKWWNGLFLYQLKPFMFNNRFDLFTWVLMKTGLHQWLLNNPTGWLVFDVSFYAMPLLMYVAFQRSIRMGAIVSVIMLFVNWLYIQCYTLYPTNSIEGHIAWLLFPVLFMTVNQRSFYCILHALRYFFLFFFASAGLWKIVQGGLFNIDQMSGVLLLQHKEYLTSSNNWHTTFIYWLINHHTISYLLYLAGLLVELVFIAGFFTKKYDRYLVAAFIAFLVMDLLIMRISYLEVSAFLLPLLYSHYRTPGALHSER
jgi:hypothetical protein